MTDRLVKILHHAKWVVRQPLKSPKRSSILANSPSMFKPVADAHSNRCQQNIASVEKIAAALLSLINYLLCFEKRGCRPLTKDAE